MRERSNGMRAEIAHILLALARESIERTLSGKPHHGPDQMDEQLVEPRGAFVTIKKAGRLRGCIGNVEPGGPLWETVARMACAAAFDDPRFDPLTSEELSTVSIEISVLTLPRRITSPDDIHVGTHGLIVERGSQRGLLLPQVAVEWHWDRFEFLEQVCHKAGIPADSWQSKDVTLYTFSADVFTELEG